MTFQSSLSLEKRLKAGYTWKSFSFNVRKHCALDIQKWLAIFIYLFIFMFSVSIFECQCKAPRRGLLRGCGCSALLKIIRHPFRCVSLDTALTLPLVGHLWSDAVSGKLNYLNHPEDHKGIKKDPFRFCRITYSGVIVTFKVWKLKLEKVFDLMQDCSIITLITFSFSLKFWK